MKFWREVALRLAPYLYKLWAATLRYEEIGREEVEKLHAERQVTIICIWHGEIFPLWGVQRGLHLTAVISRSKDGEMAARLLSRTGFKVIRGSSSRGGAAALREVVRVMRRNAENPCVAMDGPRGPAKEVKDGVLFMAHFGQGLLVPTRVQAKNAIRLKSWDEHLIPLPFSRVRAIFGEPYAISAEKLDEPTLARERARLKQKMDELDRYAF